MPPSAPTALRFFRERYALSADTSLISKCSAVSSTSGTKYVVSLAVPPSGCPSLRFAPVAPGGANPLGTYYYPLGPAAHFQPSSPQSRSRPSGATPLNTRRPSNYACCQSAAGSNSTHPVCRRLQRRRRAGRKAGREVGIQRGDGERNARQRVYRNLASPEKGAPNPRKDGAHAGRKPQQRRGGAQETRAAEA
jgi:hypothetical protein